MRLFELDERVHGRRLRPNELLANVAKPVRLGEPVGVPRAEARDDELCERIHGAVDAVLENAVHARDRRLICGHPFVLRRNPRKRSSRSSAVHRFAFFRMSSNCPHSH